MIKTEVTSDVFTNRRVVFLLSAILITQLLILFRIPSTPPSAWDIQNAKNSEDVSELMRRIQLVRVQGGHVDVDVQNHELDVKVKNDHLVVEVGR